MRLAMLALAGLAAVAAVHADPAPPGPYAAGARVAYLAHALDAARALGPAGRTDLERGLYTGGRASCRAAAGPPTAACMIELARATCGARADRDACLVVADVILVNQRAETELVDEGTRMRLVGSATDYHAALLDEVATRHAVLAAELVLGEAGPLDRAGLPARIDRFCARRTQAPDYQRCAGALIWYITTQEAR